MLSFLFVIWIAEQVMAAPTDGTKLIAVTLVHRHGDRTPIESSINLSTNPAAVYKASIPFGFGHLTEVGKRRAYHLGQTIRKRYNAIISPKYNSSEIYIRSIDSTRAKMTILTALAAIYPPYPGSWSSEIKWVPTPYTTVPAKYDYNMFNMNCPVFLHGFKKLLTEYTPRMWPHLEVLNILSNITKVNITGLPVMAYNYYDGYTGQVSLGINLTKEVAAIMPKLEKAAGEALDVLLGDERFIALEAGVILDEFFNQADDIVYGNSGHKVRIYSVHDLNVYAFKAVSKALPRKVLPKYTSYFALELRQYTETGEYGVLPVYQSEPGAEVEYLIVAGCDALPCPIETFKKLVSVYKMDEDSWYNECEFATQLNVDETAL